MKILIHPHVDIWQYAVEGLTNRDDVKCFALNSSTNKFQQICRKIFPNKNIPSFWVLGKKLRNALSALKNGDTVILADYTDVCLLHAIDECVNKSVRKVSWFWNPIKGNKRDIDQIPLIKSAGFQIYTFDKKDADLFNLGYHDQFFPIIHHYNDDSTDVETDFYFAGFRKDRGALIATIQDVLSCFKTEFIVADTISDCISYKENIGKIQKSKCVVEIVQGVQSGLTLRPLEAIAFRKKLLTTNKDIVNQPFYKRENIFIWGCDNNNKLDEFLNSPFVLIDTKILSMFDINNWINNL